MKPEPFKLQSVLRHRELLEGRAKQDLAAALQKEQEIRAASETLQSELRRMQEELLHRQQHGISVQDLLLFEEGIARAGRRRSALLSELERAARAVQECREALLHASRDRRLLERLKEKKEVAMRREMQRRETVSLDEIALQFDREKI